ncbi:hypothetical protein [Mycobacterium sp. 1245852.3]|uniref:hypothetical protein n=1 Tax=Mycobacterium sp. 1245852.3 TaxID=1856860 RepID=UPI0007FF5E0D|nr:hypothetical protein [Mycobacterium sp. 1245852.3]OBJ85098.1 hypothetical protein A9W96_26545 [Mycobacterium sp. 1245852.3]
MSNTQRAASTNPTLPQQFAALERYVPKWALDDAAQRANTRAATSIGELREFYSTMLPFAADAAESLRGTPVEDLDPPRLALLKLLLSLVDVAVGVECFDAPTVPRGYDQARLKIAHVPNMMPAL